MLVLLHALSAAIVLSRSVPYGSVPRLLGARHVQPPPLLAHASASSTEKVRCGTPVLSGASLDSAGGPQLPWRQTDDATAAANANANANAASNANAEEWPMLGGSSGYHRMAGRLGLAPVTPLDTGAGPAAPVRFSTPLLWFIGLLTMTLTVGASPITPTLTYTTTLTSNPNHHPNP
jgi:hypothetical protein